MKPLFVLPDDTIAASLYRLEETRGHILSEDEYRALRQETLNELATIARRPSRFAPVAGASLFIVVAGVLTLFAKNESPLWLLALSAGAVVCALLSASRLRRRATVPTWTPEQRLVMLETLRARSLVTAEEFSRISEQIELPRAA